MTSLKMVRGRKANMKFGIFQLVPGGAGRSPEEAFHNNLEMAQTAEQLGFSSLWVAEHHFSEYGLLNDAMLYLSSVAVLTKTIRLGAAVAVVPLHNPIRLAENAAYVDIVSHGRLELGIGRGYQPHEFERFGIPMGEAQKRTEVTVRFLRRAWTEDDIDFESDFISIRGLTLVPKPVQQPHPPIWVAAVSPATFERCGSRGERILTSPNFTPIDMVKANIVTYREALRYAGHDPHSFDYPIMQQVYVAEDQSRAYFEPRTAAMEYYERLGKLLPKAEDVSDGSYDLYGRVQKNVDSLEYDNLFRTGVTFGDTSSVKERLQVLQDEVGLTMFLAWFNFGGLDHELAMRSMRRFAEEVMPHFRAENRREVPTP